MNIYPNHSPYQKRHSYNWQEICGRFTPAARTFSIEEWIGDPAAVIATENANHSFACDALPAVDPEQFEEDFCWFSS